MRVGIISPYSLTLPGGVQGQILSLARELRLQGVDARVLGPCDGPPPEPGVIPLGNSIPTAANGSVAPIAPDPSAQMRMYRAQRQHRFDVLHLHEPLSPGPCLFSLCWHPVPIVGTFHAAGGSRAYDLLNPLCRWARTHIDIAVAVSANAEKMAKDAMGGEYTILFNGVETGHYASVAPYPTDGPTVFFVGRHEERKGLSVLLAAMASLPENVRLWIASDGPQTAELRGATVGDPRIEWLGRISEGEKMARLKGATVFAAPSLHGESFGIVLIEAMAAGTPVVASDIPGYAAVAEHGRDAQLVPPGDPVALADRIEALIHDPAHARKLVAAGRHRAEEFAMAKLATRYHQMYTHLAA
ncbi:MAG: glycosyltransferase family 4 protein [Acidimicrobiales bacterium]|nr:glycosyltransferase family 4 protein [Acidimicrobiales bacterium]